MEQTLLSTDAVRHALNGQRISGNVVKMAREYVSTLYNQNGSGDHYYHTYTRAHEIVRACKKIARSTGLTDAEREILLLAAWFVDSGHTTTGREPEKKSIEIARTFLNSLGYSANKTGQVVACVQGIQSNQPPQSHLAKVLNDGYWLYLGQTDYGQQAELLRAEQERLTEQPFSDQEWVTQCLDDFRNHPFHTEFAQREYSRQRIENLLAVNRKLRKLTHSAGSDHKLKEDRPSSFREIEDAFKLTSRNYVKLVGVADRKAGLLIHISSLIISIVLAVLIRHLAENPALLGPTILLLVVCSVTIAFAILASRPTHPTKGSIPQAHEPALFFGSFDKTDPAFERISWETYHNQIRELRANDKEAIFALMSGELFQTRQLLSRKFRHLSYAYLTFLVGIVATVLAYIVAVLIQPATT